VIYAGRITDPFYAEKVLEEGKIDIVGMARQLVADPMWPVKAFEGDFADIVPCIGCNVCMVSYGTFSRCSVNAELAKEKEFKIVPAIKSKRIMVVGGGPAGMEAARVAALRGHRVYLFEKERTLGGQLKLSSNVPHKDDIKKFLDYLIHQVDKLDINLNLGSEVTDKEINDFQPDVLIIATGALPLILQIPGADSSHITTSWDVLAGREVGENVVIIGGGSVGCETAEYLIHKGVSVTICEMLAELSSDAEKYTIQIPMLQRFANYEKLRILVKCKVEAIDSKEVIVDQAGQKSRISGDSIILAVGSVPNNGLIGNANRNSPNVYPIGDCARIGRIVDAVNHASYIARIV
jgi:pyruvate/2-oxoglutarate dehydrogenase complex dihydrolipoamide dehydrogenase (E3) component